VLLVGVYVGDLRLPVADLSDRLKDQRRSRVEELLVVVLDTLGLCVAVDDAGVAAHIQRVERDQMGREPSDDLAFPSCAPAARGLQTSDAETPSSCQRGRIPGSAGRWGAVQPRSQPVRRF
jgi:hypothetical protein